MSKSQTIKETLAEPQETRVARALLPANGRHRPADGPTQGAEICRARRNNFFEWLANGRDRTVLRKRLQPLETAKPTQRAPKRFLRVLRDPFAFSAVKGFF